ncbi:DUF6538 domain-containing protein [Cerasicoccus fimbriatus]|uniref:DUF6538 domain-containing protein n=1 Tax=Cerasicoccus fimbriatus TaxID=3014554 RepID=UPI0022B5D271|nr:DUF6538 domain-containing protein [Cerasicoccus sp. TK19100]
MPHLQKRPSGYYYRQRIPLALKPAFRGQQEFSISLKTRKATVAKRRALPLMADVHELFNQLKEAMDTFGHKHAQAIAENWRRRALNRDFERRVINGIKPPSKDLELQIQKRSNQIQSVSYKDDAQWANRQMNEFGLDIPTDTRDWRLMAYYLWQADIQRLEEMLNRNTDIQAHQMVYLPEKGIQSSKPEPGKRLSAVLEEWEREKPRPERTRKQWRNEVKRFSEYLNGDPMIHEITTKQIRGFRDTLRKMPSKLGNKHPELTFTEIIQHYDDQEVPRLKPKSINNALTAISSLLSWCVEEEIIAKNPALGIKEELPEIDPDERQPFDHTDLKHIFEYSPVYLLNKRYDLGGKEACYWIPLLALYTGARMDELGNLYPKDVIQEGNVTYISIYADKNKRVKNRYSIRKVPLHRDVIQLGFIDYVAKMKLAGEQWLFPDLKPYQGRRTHYFSRWVNTYLRTHCGVEDTRKVFHSFRHTFKDLCRNTMIPDDINDALTGHSRKTTGGKYGNGHALKVLDEAVQRIEFPVTISPWKKLSYRL